MLHNKGATIQFPWGGGGYVADKSITSTRLDRWLKNLNVITNNMFI